MPPQDAHDVGVSLAWLTFGGAMQSLFVVRGLVQWRASETARDSVLPAAFWWISLIASSGLGLYFLRRGDPVGEIGQLLAVLVAVRNLALIHVPAGRRWPWIAGLCSLLVASGILLFRHPPFAIMREGVPMPWVVYGFIAQAVFTGRWLVQWIAAERSRSSVAPPAFWWCSLIGGLALLPYFIRRGDPIGQLSQLFNSVLFARNLWLIHRRRSSATP